MKPIINTFIKQNVIETLKLTPTIIIAICYYISRWKYEHQVLGRFLECRKCNVLVVTQALVLCLICMPSAFGPAALGLLSYISGKTLMLVLQLLHIIQQH